MIDAFVMMGIMILSLFGFVGLLVLLQSPIPKLHPLLFTIFMLLLVLSLLIIGVHIQIPDQDYCDDIYENKYVGLGAVFYQESLHTYEFSLNESKCMYSGDGKFIVNPKYSVLGLRI